MKAGILLGVAQPVDAVAHDEAHGARIVIGPHGLAAVPAFGGQELLRHQVERVIPGDRRELARAFRPLAHQGMQQAVGVMDALRIARDLGADHARRIKIVGGAAHAADTAAVEHLDLERAGRGAVVRTGRRRDADRRTEGLIHGPSTLDHDPILRNRIMVSIL
jgi:hypothetical protein